MRALGLMIVWVLSQCLAFSAHAGPNSGVGGDIVEDERPSPGLVEGAIARSKSLLPLVMNYWEITARSEPIGLLLFDHPADSDVFAKLKTVKFVPVPGDCLDKDGKHTDAAVGYLGENEVCFSVDRIKARTTNPDLFRKVLVLAAHEMVHVMKGDENQARSFAAQVNSTLAETDIFDYEKWATVEFWNHVKYLNRRSKMALKSLDLAISSNENSVIFCSEYMQLMETVIVPTIFDGVKGRIGMAPVRAAQADSVSLLEDKFSFDELFCADSDGRRAAVMKWFGNSSELSSDEFAKARNLSENPDAPGTFRAPKKGDLKGLREEVKDFIQLTDQLLQQQ